MLTLLVCHAFPSILKLGRNVILSFVFCSLSNTQYVKMIAKKCTFFISNIESLFLSGMKTKQKNRAHDKQKQ